MSALPADELGAPTVEDRGRSGEERAQEADGLVVALQQTGVPGGGRVEVPGVEGGEVGEADPHGRRSALGHGPDAVGDVQREDTVVRHVQDEMQAAGAWVFSDTVETRLGPSRYGDASGVRGAAWLWD